MLRGGPFGRVSRIDLAIHPSCCNPQTIQASNHKTRGGKDERENTVEQRLARPPVPRAELCLLHFFGAPPRQEPVGCRLLSCLVERETRATHASLRTSEVRPAYHFQAIVLEARQTRWGHALSFCGEPMAYRQPLAVWVCGSKSISLRRNRHVSKHFARLVNSMFRRMSQTRRPTRVQLRAGCRGLCETELGVACHNLGVP